MKGHTMADTLAPVADRAMVLTDLLLGLASLHTAKPSMFIEWSGNDTPITVRQTDGWTMTLDHWEIQLFDGTADVEITPGGKQWNSEATFTLPPMEALTYLHNVIMREQFRV